MFFGEFLQLRSRSESLGFQWWTGDESLMYSGAADGQSHGLLHDYPLCRTGASVLAEEFGQLRRIEGLDQVADHVRFETDARIELREACCNDDAEPRVMGAQLVDQPRAVMPRHDGKCSPASGSVPTPGFFVWDGRRRGAGAAASSPDGAMRFAALPERSANLVARVANPGGEVGNLGGKVAASAGRIGEPFRKGAEPWRKGSRSLAMEFRTLAAGLRTLGKGFVPLSLEVRNLVARVRNLIEPVHGAARVEASADFAD